MNRKIPRLVRVRFKLFTDWMNIGCFLFGMGLMPVGKIRKAKKLPGEK